ncbi:hypothetical protein P4C99_21460 [Pontiellaceae bacterium B1224]|nr:hypothetical protein [Pontiellaceae bacterium B1224]
MKKIIIKIIALSFSLSAIASEIPKVTELKSDEKIQINIKSVGCFHSRVTNVMLTDSSLIYYGENYNEKNKWPLSLEDKTDLEKIIEYYSSDHIGGSTTTDTVTISFFKNGKLISKATHVDEDLRLEYDDDKKTLNDVVIQCFKRYKAKQEK